MSASVASTLRETLIWIFQIFPAAAPLLYIAVLNYLFDPRNFEVQRNLTRFQRVGALAKVETRDYYSSGSRA